MQALLSSRVLGVTASGADSCTYVDAMVEQELLWVALHTHWIDAMSYVLFVRPDSTECGTQTAAAVVRAVASAEAVLESRR